MSVHINLIFNEEMITFDTKHMEDSIPESL
jgi:hypothetical protein